MESLLDGRSDKSADDAEEEEEEDENENFKLLKKIKKKQIIRRSGIKKDVYTRWWLTIGCLS